MSLDVPTLPLPPDDLLDAHDAAHRRLGSLRTSVPDDVRRLFDGLQHRLTVESLAYIQPVMSGADDAVLVPPPRTFLTRTQELRMQGARAAYRHIDSRIAMVGLGAIERVLEPSTPLVLHGLLEGPTPSGRETNPGMLRATPTAWRPESNSFMHPPATMCPELVQAALVMATEAPAPPCARAAWLTFAMLSIHPFVDGNGRTSRALYLAVAADDPDVSLDRGVLEQWSADRAGYVSALQAGQQVERYDAAAMDAEPFVRFAVDASAIGARRCSQRIEAFERRWAEVSSAIGDEEGAAAFVVAVEILRCASPGELAGFGFDAATVTSLGARLAREGVLRWVDRPPSRRTYDDPVTHALALA